MVLGLGAIRAFTGLKLSGLGTLGDFREGSGSFSELCLESPCPQLLQLAFPGLCILCQILPRAARALKATASTTLQQFPRLIVHKYRLLAVWGEDAVDDCDADGAGNDVVDDDGDGDGDGGKF